MRASTLPAGGQVFDDEQTLARTHQAQFAAGELFDSRRVLARSRRASSRRAGIFRTKAGDIGRELVVLLARSHSREQSLVADEGIHNEHANNKEEQAGQNAVAPGLCPLECLRFDGLARRHLCGARTLARRTKVTREHVPYFLSSVQALIRRFPWKPVV